MHLVICYCIKEPAQFTSSFTVFAGTDTELPFQVGKTYMDRFQEIAGRKAYDVTLTQTMRQS